jgi:hypothetical protein
MFSNGCPACGYSAPPPEKKTLVQEQANPPLLQADRPVQINPSSDYIWSLPLWVYIVTGLSVLAVCIALYMKL